MRLGLLSIVDRGVLEAYCATYGRWRDLENRIDKAGVVKAQKSGLVNLATKERMLLLRLATEFGFTPSSRSRVKAEAPGEG